MTNEMIGWGLAIIGGLFLFWAWWPKNKVTETLEEVKATETPAKVEPQITDAVTQTAPKKTAAKKAPAKKTDAPKKTTTTKVKAAPKKSVKKGKK